MNTSFIKENVFKTVDFTFEGEIEFGSFDGVKVEYDGKKAKLSANAEACMARALFLLAMNISEGKTSFTIEEHQSFKSCGVMLDCSRNAVMTVENVKKYINTLASLFICYPVSWALSVIVLQIVYHIVYKKELKKAQAIQEV